MYRHRHQLVGYYKNGVKDDVHEECKSKISCFTWKIYSDCEPWK